MLEEFLKRFYETISFSKTEAFKAAGFQSLFCKDAVLLEKQGNGRLQKTVESHIQEFKQVIQEYPQLFVEGFHEHQLSYEVIEEEAYYLVSSHYEKCYHRSGKMIHEHGIDTMMILKLEEELKISMILF